jgi:hypothetical protein
MGDRRELERKRNEETGRGWRRIAAVGDWLGFLGGLIRVVIEYF